MKKVKVAFCPHLDNSNEAVSKLINDELSDGGQPSRQVWDLTSIMKVNGYADDENDGYMLLFTHRYEEYQNDTG